ncbi:MAG TPA: hypothetical protein VF119_03400 [Candidatus Limnocylindrales bacterium]
MEVDADPVVETRRIMTASDAERLPLRALGGIAVALLCPTIRRLSPPRTYHDIDLATPSAAAGVTRLLTDLGYDAARRFNTLNGSERLLFHDPAGRRIDVFVGTLRMCHQLSLDDAFAIPSWTLPPADLVLSKLQIVELTERDAQDLLALFADFELTGSGAVGISVERIERVCRDWGWWRTIGGNLDVVEALWRTERTDADPETVRTLDRGLERVAQLRDVLASSPRPIGWRIRAMVGSRVRWYELPEDVRSQEPNESGRPPAGP